MNHSHGTVAQKTFDENLLRGRSKTLTIFISYQNFNIVFCFYKQNNFKIFLSRWLPNPLFVGTQSIGTSFYCVEQHTKQNGFSDSSFSLFSKLTTACLKHHIIIIFNWKRTNKININLKYIFKSNIRNEFFQLVYSFTVTRGWIRSSLNSFCCRESNCTYLICFQLFAFLNLPLKESLK